MWETPPYIILGALFLNYLTQLRFVGILNLIPKRSDGVAGFFEPVPGQDPGRSAFRFGLKKVLLLGADNLGESKLAILTISCVEAASALMRRGGTKY